MRQIELEPAYEIITAPSAALFTAADLHAQLRIDTTDEDTLIEDYIEAATQTVESDSRLYLRPAELKLHVDERPSGFEPLLIQRGPVTAVTAITYIDTAGVEQTWDAAEYDVDLVSLPARISPAFGESWPVARIQQRAIAVAFDAGYAAVGNVPAVALQAIKLLVGHWFDNREAAGDVTEEIAFSYSALLERLGF